MSNVQHVHYNVYVVHYKKPMILRPISLNFRKEKKNPSIQDKQIQTAFVNSMKSVPIKFNKFEYDQIQKQDRQPKFMHFPTAIKLGYFNLKNSIIM